MTWPRRPLPSRAPDGFYDSRWSEAFEQSDDGLQLVVREAATDVKAEDVEDVEFLTDEENPDVGVGIRIREAKISHTIVEARKKQDKRVRKPRKRRQREV